MANTYTLISSNVLSSSAASVTFSAIPSTYTDLVVRCSVRINNTYSMLGITFNNSTTSRSSIELQGNGAATASNTWTTLNVRGTNSSSYTADTFSSAEFYIPNYAGSNNKCASGFGTQETNSVGSLMSANALLWSNTSAISSIELQQPNGASFVSGSSFYLYGIKNS
jgi:hypothetical protein